MLVLATDLDGAFLGGSIEERNALYGLIRGRRTQFLLIFVTGRGVQNVRSLLADPAIPAPDYVIADVGATVRQGLALQPLEPLDTELAECWRGAQPVVQATAALKSLQRPKQAQERRCSFYTEDEKLVAAVRAAVEPLGYEVLYSAHRYLDVLAAGVSKGATLNRLIKHLGLAPEQVLIAGDSLNDLSMFSLTNFRGVVVGGSELALRECTSARARTHHATAAGAGGILEAMAAFSLLPKFQPTGRGASELVIIYHRQPFDEVAVDGRVQRLPCSSPNGILPTLLGLFRDGRQGAWLAWSSSEAARIESHVQLADSQFGHLTLARLFLTAEEVDSFYYKLSKEALWPVLHSFIERAGFDHLHWQRFVTINERFAHLAADEAAPGALVWIHDYNLWLVPKFLRDLRPDLQLAYFHHTPFPAADIFNVIPWSRQIVQSLLSCDYIGFHVPRYRENFVDAAASHFPVHARFVARDECRYQNAQRCALQQPHNRANRAAGPARTAGRSSGRGGSGTCEILPAVCGVSCVPAGAAGEILGTQGRAQCRASRLYEGNTAEAAGLRALPDDESGVVRGAHLPDQHLYAACRGHDRIRRDQAWRGTSRGQDQRQILDAGVDPITFMIRQEPFERLAAFFAVADIAWVTPLRDGLNLVAKEYVAVRGRLRRNGVLILSEFAGCSIEMDGALTVNPYDLMQMADVLRQALAMSKAEQRDRMRRLWSAVQSRDVEWWARDFIRCATKPAAVRSLSSGG